MFFGPVPSHWALLLIIDPMHKVLKVLSKKMPSRRAFLNEPEPGESERALSLALHKQRI